MLKASISGSRNNMAGPKILLLDIETFPNIAYTWGKYDQNVIRFKQESCIATYAYKWLDEPEAVVKGLPDYKGYKKGSYNDKKLVADLWKVIDEADIIVAHNGDQFDVKVINGRFLFHNMKPPSPFKTVDTKKAVKRVARFNSNSLDDLNKHFLLGKKIKTDFDLWDGCINGDPDSWQRMMTYNTQDVYELEKLYLRVRPWISNHPNFTVETGAMCPKCNSSDVQFRGVSITNTRRYRRFQCKNCGGWGRTVVSEGSAAVTNG